MFARLKEVILTQIKQGITAHGLALSCVLGVFWGSFPIIGATTVLCVLTVSLLKMNHPASQAVNYIVMAPVQLMLIPVFLHVGASICGVPAVSLNPKTIVVEFFTSPGVFFSHYGMACLQAILAWAIIMPISCFIIYLILKFFFNKAIFRQQKQV